MKRELMSYQRLVDTLVVHVDGSAVGGGTLTTDGLLTESQHCKITENGAGDYTITLNSPGRRVCRAVATSITAGLYCEIAAASTSAVQILHKTTAANVATADADFYVLIFVYNSLEDT